MTLGAITGAVPVPVTLELLADEAADGRLRRVRSSCPCLHVREYPAMISSGRTRRVQLRLHVERPGDFEYQVWLEQHGQVPFRVVLRGHATGAAAATGKLPFGIAETLLTRALTPVPALPLATPAELLADRQKERHLLLVDVRTAEAYRQVHLPGTVNLPASVLRTHPQLRGRHVVVIGQGQPSPRLADACERLIQSGWAASVRLLDGGLARFARERGAARLHGDATALNRLTPAAFHESRAVEGWLVVDATGGREPLVDHMFTPCVMPKDGLGDTAALRDPVGAPVRRVLVLDDGEAAELADCAIPATLDCFGLVGGWLAYARFLQEQSAYLNPETVRTRTSGGCAGCP